ncbi:MAG: GAF domain-containing sensor histidine kinase [Gammaproteobacteria bacterium]|nr:GAF domain-containing sensor histidine kinase [Gammaproteobacteria bacterium]
MEAQLHPQEAQRLEALRAYQILDTPTEARFDAITELAADLFDAPIAVINFIDQGRQWFKSEVGLGVREMELAPSICAHAILDHDMFIVEDTTTDSRFIDNPLVTGEPHLRFYAGKLLTSENQLPLGTLCVLDFRPREFSPDQRRTLDILGRHVMELLEFRRAAQKRDELAMALGEELEAHKQSLGVVSHDLRAPLHVISMMADSLTELPIDEISAPQIGSQIKRATRSMSLLIDDLLDAESIRNGSIHLAQRPHRPVALVQPLADLYQSMATENGIAFSTGDLASLPPVSCDDDRVGRILTNLLHNAFKFTPTGGTVELDAKLDGEFVSFEVRDSGCGIPRQHLERVFERHWQSNGDKGGAGLGLSIVKALVEAHGGRISLDSEPDAGCTVRFSLPIA